MSGTVAPDIAGIGGGWKSALEMGTFQLTCAGRSERFPPSFVKAFTGVVLCVLCAVASFYWFPCVCSDGFGIVWREKT